MLSTYPATCTKDIPVEIDITTLDAYGTRTVPLNEAEYDELLAVRDEVLALLHERDREGAQIAVLG